MRSMWDFSQAGKIKGCEQLLQWVEPVRNHFWHCAETCGGEVEILKVKVLMNDMLTLGISCHHNISCLTSL